MCHQNEEKQVNFSPEKSSEGIKLLPYTLLGVLKSKENIILVALLVILSNNVLLSRDWQFCWETFRTETAQVLEAVNWGSLPELFKGTVQTSAPAFSFMTTI